VSVDAHCLCNWYYESVGVTLGGVHYVRGRLFQGLAGLQPASATLGEGLEERRNQDPGFFASTGSVSTVETGSTKAGRSAA
jgi:hypothetical protein